MTPGQLSKMPWEEAVKICRGYAIAGFETITQLPRPGVSKPFRFVYISGANTVQDPAQKPWVMGDYCLMRVCSQGIESLARTTSEISINILRLRRARSRNASSN